MVATDYNRTSACARRSETTINWRLLLALALNGLLWAGIIEAVGVSR